MYSPGSRPRAAPLPSSRASTDARKRSICRPGVVVVVLALHLVPGEVEQPGDRVAVGGVPARPRPGSAPSGWPRPSRPGRAASHPAWPRRSSSGAEHLAQRLSVPVARQPQVHEPGAGDLGALHLGKPGAPARSSSASSRGGRLRCPASRSATLVAYSPCVASEGRSSSTSVPASSLSAASTRSSALGGDTRPGRGEHVLERADVVARPDADHHVARIEDRVRRGARVVRASLLGHGDDGGAGVRRGYAARGSICPITGSRRTSICSKRRSGPSWVVTTLRKDATCGFSTRFAITRPAVEYGITTRSAPGQAQFPLRVLVGGARDDQQVGPRRPRRERHVQVVRIRVERRDQRLRALETGRAQVLVLDRVPLERQHPRFARGFDLVGIVVDDDEAGAGAAELVRDPPSDAAVAADDRVTAQPFDRLLPPSLRLRTARRARSPPRAPRRGRQR